MHVEAPPLPPSPHPSPSPSPDARAGGRARGTLRGAAGIAACLLATVVVAALLLAVVAFRAERAAEQRKDSVIGAREAVLEATALANPVEHKLISEAADDAFKISFQDAVDIGRASSATRDALALRRETADDPREIALIDEAVTTIDGAKAVLETSRASGGGSGIDVLSEVLPAAAAGQVPVSRWIRYSGGVAADENAAVSGQRRKLIASVALAFLGGIGLGLLLLAQLRRAQRQTYELLHAAAVTDPLTGLRNHGAFHDRIAEEVARSRRNGAPLSLVIFDIDHFKRVNDTHGHQKGDAVLTAVGRSLARAAREEDLVARIGGEEFAWLVIDSTSSGAEIVAERARRTIAAIDLDGIRVTASAGVAERGAEESAESLINRADQALYRAKGGGRDLTVNAGLDDVTTSADEDGAESPRRAPS